MRRDEQEGDWYPTVRAWMARLGTSDLDRAANRIPITRATARLYVSACLGPTFPLRFRRMRSAGRGGATGITLDATNGKGFTLGTLLHEIAHARQHLRLQERRALRNVRLRATGGPRPVINAREHRGHGEPFCRTYARLLRDVML